MNGQARSIALAAVLLGFSGLVLAALGRHVVDIQSQPEMQGIWQTASLIQLFHTAALLAFSALMVTGRLASLRWSCWLMVAGTVIFSGSLYLRVATQGEISGFAPAGGLMMMLGWLLAGYFLARRV